MAVLLCPDGGDQNEHGQDAGAAHGGRAGAGVWGRYTPADGGGHKENTPHRAGWRLDLLKTIN